MNGPDPPLPREVATCGSCTWFVVGDSPGTLVKDGTCEEDCSGHIPLFGMGIGSISEGAFEGLPQVQQLTLSWNEIQHISDLDFEGLPQLHGLDLAGNKIQHISDHAFQKLPQLESLELSMNPLAGLRPMTFSNNTALQWLNVHGTALGCVPAGGIPDTAYILHPTSYIDGAARCPAGCEVDTVYDVAADACVSCPAGLQPPLPGTVGLNGLGSCVPDGWNAVPLATCGSCAFWRTLATNTLVRTGSCGADCSGDLILHDMRITAVEPGVFTDLTGLGALLIYGNPLGCVLGVPNSVQIIQGQSVLPQENQEIFRCPDNCTVGTFFVYFSNTCPTAGDGICDEPVWCDVGTDCFDCQDMLDYSMCDGYRTGFCLPCPDGLITEGVGAVGAESCVHPVTSVISNTSAPTPSPCASDSLPFSVAGTALCVPHGLFPAPSVQDCLLDKTWRQLRTLDSNLSTGGLGKDMVAGEFEVWICTRHSSCGSAEGAMCFTYSEGLEVFVPWGLESVLKLTKWRR